VLSPFLAIIYAIILLNRIIINTKSVNIIFALISLSFALLAFTQKSLFYEDTDIQRYYDGLAPILNQDYSVILFIFSQDILTYVFTPVNVAIVLLTRNVQYISVFWTFIIYYLFFLSISNYIEIRNDKWLKNRKFLSLLIIFSIFGAILFTQVTETIKSAVAISLFFYTFSLYIKNEKILRIFILLFLAIGIHTQALMLLPLFLYNKIDFRPLLIVTIIIVFISPYINIIELFLSFIPSTAWSDLLIERVSSYGTDTGSSSSIRYIGIGIVILITAILLFKFNCLNNSNKFGNIILIYIIIMFLNFSNSHAFIRFANFISFIATIEFIELYMDKRLRQLSYAFMFMFLILNFQMTYGRTLSGGYCSSYMDNSIFKLLFSNVFDYLSYKAYIS